MSMYTNTKKSKKLIIVLVLLLLFNFIFSNIVMASETETLYGGSNIKDILDNSDIEKTDNNGGFFDIATNFSKLLFFFERGLLEIVNNVFCDDDNEYVYEFIDEDLTVELNLTPESIIKGKFILFNANIFEEISEEENSEYYDGGQGKEKTRSGRIELRNTVSGWYYALRNFAIIALLSVLVYVGIRMITSTISQDKAKYKIMFKDWLVALCLLIVMHYIMISILNVSDDITKAVGTSGTEVSQTVGLMKKIGVITQADASYKVTQEGKTYEDVRAVAVDDNGNYTFYTIGNALAYMLLLAVIIFYTGLFAVKYLKRVFTLIFLILLGPISCITYPIDKISDGKAQAFNKWFFEFIYNVIIQPFHLLIYIVLVGSATQLASDNLLYSIVCFAVMIPAEKFIKKMFGFKDELGSPLGAFAGGAIAGQMFKNVFSGGGSKNHKSNTIEGKSESNNSIRENKLNPGLPGSENATGVSTDYNSEDRETDIDLSGSSDDESPLNEEGDTTPLGSGGADDTMEKGEGDSLPEEDGNDDTIDNEAENTNFQEDIESKEGIYSPKGISKFKNAVRGIREHRDKKLMAKYGSKNRAVTLGKYLARKGVSIGGRTITGATTLLGTGALGVLGFMCGQGAKGAMIGAALGANIGNKVNKGISGLASSVKEYGTEARYAMKDEEERRKERVKKMMKTAAELENASQSFSKRNAGKIASTRELNQELADRAKFKEMKLTDDQIDDAMEIYADKKETLGEEAALQMALASTKLGSRYSAKEWEDPKKVQNAYDTLMKEYEKIGVNKDLADETVRDIIKNAASTQGVKNPALFAPSRKQSYMSSKTNIDNAKKLYAQRHGGRSPNKKQLNQELDIGFNLKKAGLSNTDIDNFFNSYITSADAIREAKLVVGRDAGEEVLNTELERRFEIKAKIGIDNEKELTSYINAAEAFIKDNKQIETPTNGQIYSEVKQMVTVKDSYNISESSKQKVIEKINDIRMDEERFIKKSIDKSGAKAVISAQRSEARQNSPEESKKMQTQAQYQREFLTQYSVSEMQNDAVMEKAKKKIVKKLEKNGDNNSQEFREIFADEVISKCKKFSGI